MFTKEQFERVVTFFNENNLWAPFLGTPNTPATEDSGGTDSRGFKVSKGKNAHKYLSATYPNNPTEMPAYFTGVPIVINDKLYKANVVKFNPYAWQVIDPATEGFELGRKEENAIETVATLLTQRGNQGKLSDEDQLVLLRMQELLSGK